MKFLFRLGSSLLLRGAGICSFVNISGISPPVVIEMVKVPWQVHLLATCLFSKDRPARVLLRDPRRGSHN